MFCTLKSLSTDADVISLRHWQQVCCMMLEVQDLSGLYACRPRPLWVHTRGLGEHEFFDRNLLGMCMDVSTLEYLYSTLAPTLQKQDTNMRSTIPIQVKVAVVISRLAIGNSMQTIVDLYRIGLSTSQKAVTQFTGAIKTIILQKFIKWPISNQPWQNLHLSLKTCIIFLMWLGQLMGRTNPLLFFSYMQLIITTEKNFTQCCYKVWCLASVCFGTLI